RHVRLDHHLASGEVDKAAPACSKGNRVWACADQGTHPAVERVLRAFPVPPLHSDMLLSAAPCPTQAWRTNTHAWVVGGSHVQRRVVGAVAEIHCSSLARTSGSSSVPLSGQMRSTHTSIAASAKARATLIPGVPASPMTVWPQTISVAR